MPDKPMPRVDKDGVPWCDNACQNWHVERSACMITGEYIPTYTPEAVEIQCLPAVRDMARNLREARACIRRMHWHFRDTERVYFAGETEHASAFDAAMKEVP